MRRCIAVLLALSLFLNSAFSQAVPVSRLQGAISAAIQQKAFRRGFAANDPRFGATLNTVSSYVGTVAGSSAAAVVAGAITAPAWATVAIAAGVGAVVTLGVTLAIGGIVDWLFSSNPSDSTPVTQHFSSSQPAGNGLVAGGAYWRSSILNIYGSDAMTVIQTAIAQNWAADTTSTYQVGTCTTSSNPTSTSCLVTRVNKTTGYNQTGYAAVGASYYASGAPGSCQPGYVYQNSGCVAAPSQTPADAKVSAQAAINNLPASELTKPLNPQVVASLADRLWQDAAAQPGYAGLPYVASDPIAASDVDAWRQANPASWPTVQDYVAPQPANSSPWSLPSNPTSTTQDTSVPTSPSTNPASQNALQNLGPDPGIGAPALEATPTAQQILAPILGLLADFRAFVVPAHESTCPKPTFQVFGKSIVMDAHCNIAEQQRTTLYAVMAAVWLLAGALIVLRA